jgi:hypothetical protein
MRREWSAWIKNRQWHEFEKLAKTDPSQPLADTVSELERGFPDKVDRKALKKVLFLLSRSGFVPSAILEGEYAPEELGLQEFGPKEFGLLTTAACLGEIHCSYGYTKNDKQIWLHTTIHTTKGILKASEDTMTTESANIWHSRLTNSETETYLIAKVPGSYALGRIAEALANSKAVPSVIAMWRTLIEKSSIPGDYMPKVSALEAPSDQWPSRATLEPSLLWRLELGEVAPALDPLVEIYSKRRGPDEVLLDRLETAMKPFREVAISDSVVKDHGRRLDDLAYILELRADSRAQFAVSYAKELRSRRSESRYACELFNLTIHAMLQASGVIKDPDKLE